MSKRHDVVAETGARHTETASTDTLHGRQSAVRNPRS
jgi:hypothetical protein